MNQNLLPTTEKKTTLVVMMQSITIDFNFEQFLWHSSELGIKGKGVKYGYSKCVYSQVLKQKFLNSLKDRHDSLPLLVNITCKRSLFIRRLRSELSL